MNDDAKAGGVASTTAHKPVLLSETLGFLLSAPALERTKHPVLFDGTVGGGGHTLAFLRALPGGLAFGCDRDAEALNRASSRLGDLRSRALLFKANFAEIPRMIEEEELLFPPHWPRSLRSTYPLQFDALLLDLGISSDQLDDLERGFSFRSDAPLDMRLDRRTGATGGEILNTASEQELRRIFFHGDLGSTSLPLAREVIRRRPINSAREFAELCEEVLRPRLRKGANRKRRRVHHPATVPFQALRMAVNDELGSLRRFLDRAPEVMAPGSRLAVICFHSLEDEEVTRRMRCWGRQSEPGRGLPGRPPLGTLLTRNAVRPSEAEVAHNPRARSARLRVFERSMFERAEGEEHSYTRGRGKWSSI